MAKKMIELYLGVQTLPHMCSLITSLHDETFWALNKEACNQVFDQYQVSTLFCETNITP